MAGAKDPGAFLGTEEEARVAKLVREAEQAKLAKTKDRFNLPPVRKGYLRGFAINIRRTEQPCEFGTLQIAEFELADTRKGPGVPLRMAGTYFTGHIMDGTLLDVPDPTPNVRPIVTDVVYEARN